MKNLNTPLIITNVRGKQFLQTISELIVITAFRIKAKSSSRLIMKNINGITKIKYLCIVYSNALFMVRHPKIANFKYISRDAFLIFEFVNCLPIKSNKI